MPGPCPGCARILNGPARQSDGTVCRIVELDIVVPEHCSAVPAAAVHLADHYVSGNLACRRSGEHQETHQSGPDPFHHDFLPLCAILSLHTLPGGVFRGTRVLFSPLWPTIIVKELTVTRGVPFLAAFVIFSAQLDAQTRGVKIDALVQKYSEYGQFTGSVPVAEEGRDGEGPREVRRCGLTKTAEYALEENELNGLGYQLLQEGKTKEAIEVFTLNVAAYPKSWNVYDSLGEAYMNDGDKKLAILNYERSLELNASNAGAVEALKKLKTAT
jgi:tetratricopeptide (TPR) repeat protein